MSFRNLYRRMERLARAASGRNLKPSWPPGDEERVANHPEGPALLAELAAIAGRITQQSLPHSPALPSGGDWLTFFRQEMLRDERAREVCCRLAEIRGGLADPGTDGSLPEWQPPTG